MRFNINKISYQKQEEMIDIFCEIISRLSKDEIKDFFKDLMNRQERAMIIRRFLAAEKLAAGQTFQEIQDEMHMSPVTLSKIDRWLNFGRNGYKKAISRHKK